MINDLNELLPEHKTYVEVLGGRGDFLFRKPPGQIEVYNDIDSTVNLLFEVLRNEKKRKQLIEKMSNFQSSKEELETGDWREEENEMEKVKKFALDIMKMMSSVDNRVWNYKFESSRRNVADIMEQANEDFIYAITRLRDIQIENLDIERCINKYDNESTIFCVNTLAREYNQVKLISLIKLLADIKGDCLLIGEENEIFKKLKELNWNILEVEDYILDKDDKFNVWINYKSSVRI